MKNKAQRTANVIKNAFNFRKWSDWDRTQASMQFLERSFKRFFVPQSQVANETFEEACTRLHLSEVDIEKKKGSLWRMTILMLTVGALLLCYGIYQLIFGSYLGLCLSLLVVVISIVMAFRYHFWYFQMKEHKLGCSFNEWYRRGLWGEK